MSSAPPASIDATLELLKSGDYIADRSLATVLYLALKLGRPLFCEGEAGGGKTEIAQGLATTLEAPLVRLPGHQGPRGSSGVYERDHPPHIVVNRPAEAQGGPDRGRLPAHI